MNRESLYREYVRFRNALYHYPFVLAIYSFFFSTIPNIRQSRILNKRGLSDLQLISNVLEEAGVETFCEFGTLLGLVREGSFIPHDIDIDMGILKREDFTWSRVKDALESKGIALDHYHAYDGVVTEQTYLLPDGLTVDFFLYEVNVMQNQMTTYVYFKDHERVYNEPCERSVKALSYTLIDGVTHMNCMESGFLIPENPEAHLCEIYGPMWRTPDPSYKPDRTLSIMASLGHRYDV